MFKLLFLHAKCKAVPTSLTIELTFNLRLDNKILTQSSWFFKTAKCKGVHPSLFFKLISHFNV